VRAELAAERRRRRTVNPLPDEAAARAAPELRRWLGELAGHLDDAVLQELAAARIYAETLALTADLPPALRASTDAWLEALDHAAAGAKSVRALLKNPARPPGAPDPPDAGAGHG
jgi:hypothetical protein